MGKTIGIVAIKGGVGKTTIAASLATDLAINHKKKVLLIDANYSAPNLGLHMDILNPSKTIHHVIDKKVNIKNAVQNKFGVDVIPGDYVYNRQINYLKLKEKIQKVKNKYDFILLDSSPSLNEEILSTIIASDSIFMVTTPDYPTLSCTLKAAKLSKQRGKKIAGLIINKIRDPKYELNLKEIEKLTEIPVIARIPDEKKATKSTFTRIPLPIYSKRSPFSKEINRLSAALTRNKERRPLLKKLMLFNFGKEEINRQLLKDTFYKKTFK